MNGTPGNFEGWHRKVSRSLGDMGRTMARGKCSTGFDKEYIMRGPKAKHETLLSNSRAKEGRCFMRLAAVNAVASYCVALILGVGAPRSEAQHEELADCRHMIIVSTTTTLQRTMNKQKYLAT